MYTVLALKVWLPFSLYCNAAVHFILPPLILSLPPACPIPLSLPLTIYIFLSLFVYPPLSLPPSLSLHSSFPHFPSLLSSSSLLFFLLPLLSSLSFAILCFPPSLTFYLSIPLSPSPLSPILSPTLPPTPLPITLPPTLQWNYDEVTATYFLLLQQKHRGKDPTINMLWVLPMSVSDLITSPRP